MAKEHKISWLNMPGFIPETWNPIIGCSKVSPGCDNCYAEKMAIRLAHMPGNIEYSHVIRSNPSKWNGKTAMVENALFKPQLWKKPRMIFVCSMGDLFHESVPFEWIERVYDMMYSNKQHIFIVLTKRPERAYQFWQWLLNKVAGVSIQDVCSTSKDNIWMGVTAENQEQANKRISILLQIPASKRYVSIEPMLGPIDFYDININGEFYHALKGFGDISGGDFGKFNGPKLDWVICGGESGPHARPMHPEWVKSVRDQCKDAGTPFFFKQWGEWSPRTWGLVQEDHKCEKWPCLKVALNGKTGRSGNADDLTLDEYSNGNFMQKVGRNKAGNILDFKQYHQWPDINPTQLIS